MVGKEVGVRAGSLPLRGNSLVVRVLPTVTTPAEAGAQVGDVADRGLRFVTATFPTGPRPSPGW
ncbi:hypothetical protein SPHINGOT1_40103 [Sphingomonas sp. T1]|nr:hypothetical protein SPHINGOT1_40103 [Sphingomonas sp. T1]